MKLLALILIFAIISVKAQDEGSGLEPPGSDIPSYSLDIVMGGKLLTKAGNFTGGGVGGVGYEKNP